MWELWCRRILRFMVSLHEFDQLLSMGVVTSGRTFKTFDTNHHIPTINMSGWPCNAWTGQVCQREREMLLGSVHICFGGPGAHSVTFDRRNSTACKIHSPANKLYVYNVGNDTINRSAVYGLLPIHMGVLWEQWFQSKIIVCVCSCPVVEGKL